jgi:predicted site-specific integrase-resolvase
MGIQTIEEEKKELKVYVYTRVSSAERKNNLESQAGRAVQYANAKGYKVEKIYKEVASGFNDDRKILNRILEELEFDILIVEHKDRLTRVGFNYLRSLLKKMGKEIIVINEVDLEEKDIIQDLISIITSYTARIYGNRRKERKSAEFIQELNKEL